MSTIHLYCDESCHLEHDHQKAMTLGAVWCPADVRAAISRKIKSIKAGHNLPVDFEIKWTKISPAKLDFYLALVDLFFAQPELRFRGVIVPDKSVLDHDRHGQTHDDFYYKTWYLLLDKFVDSKNQFRIFIDVKDTHSVEKARKLHEVLCNARYDFSHDTIQSIEAVHSHDVILLQLADLLIGAISHLHRGLDGSPAKKAVISRIESLGGIKLSKTTSPWVAKVNLLVWQPRGI